MEFHTLPSLPHKDMHAKAQSLHRLANHASPAQRETKMREAAEDFEAVFISQMLTHMFAGIETDTTFGGGQAENVYRDMMVDEYGKIMARSGGIGVADHVINQLLQTQESTGQSLSIRRE